VFLDECGVDTRMTRARAPRGRRAAGTVPWGHWKRLTVLGALALDGVVAAMSIAAATGTRVFLAFVEQVLIPALRQRPDAVVVMDNLAAHKAERVRAALDAAGIAYRYLPAYSPDLNPIEPCWSKLKGRLRTEAARSLDKLEAALGPALATITAEDARGWFRLAGYPAPNRPKVRSSTTAGVHGSLFDAASGSGGRAAGGVVASATRPGRRRGRAPVPRPASTPGAAPRARSAAAAPRPGRAAPLPPAAAFRTAAR
jgi:transposase